ncbi:MAG: hypothetical protein K0B81_07010 [Candidatus Cloacimonetes bacterium]|nr:hypothetical protein [Candidatus Cloacimonadota bacterium]
MGEYKLTFLYKKGLDYKTRNLIVLVVFLVIIIILTVVISKNLRTTREELLAQNAQKQQELMRIMTELASEDALRARLAELQEELFLTDKVMPNLNNSTITLSYIFDIFWKYKNNFYFNYRIVSSGTVNEDQEVFYHKYELTGKAYVNLLYIFIDQLERQPAFYSIEKINLGTLPPEEQGKVSFTIEFNAYYTKTGVPHEDIALKDLRERRLVYNIFYPRIHDPMRIETEEFRQMLDLSEIIIVGMTQERVFIRNRRTGNIEVMHVGDQIRYGRLQSIDWNNQEVVFRMNLTGIAEDIRLQIQPQ